jgi:3'-phosphoadenosine 5'-phosphosulfate sulfotransferase
MRERDFEEKLKDNNIQLLHVYFPVFMIGNKSYEIRSTFIRDKTLNEIYQMLMDETDNKLKNYTVALYYMNGSILRYALIPHEG